MKCLLTTAIFLLISTTLYSQTKFKHHVKIHVKEGSGEIKTEKDAEGILQIENYNYKYEIYYFNGVIKKPFPLLISGNSLVETLKERTIDGVKYSVKTDSIYKKSDSIDDFITLKKVEVLKLDKGKYKANLSVSNDTVYVNFWLGVIDTTNSNLPAFLKRKKMLSYYQLNESWRKKIPFNPEKTYFITLNNRQTVSFPYRNWEISALTVPFKYHFGFSDNDVDVSPSLNTDINLNAFVGRRFGRVWYTYDQYEDMIERKRSMTVGIIGGLSSISVDSSKTSIHTLPLSKELNVPIASLGLGGVLNLGDFNVGLFIGKDVGLSKEARKWNFHNKFWVGFGLGYKLTFLKSPS